MVDTEPVVVGLDQRHQGVAKQLGAIAAAALLTGEEAINGEQARSECSAPLLKIRKAKPVEGPVAWAS